jgi:hypothetical protein
MSDTVNWEKAYRDQTERVAELRRENAALREDNLKVHQMACAAGLERDRLRDEIAALRADAERYRHIKNSETVEVSEILQSFCVLITFDLDAAIDAARTKEAKP